MNHSAVENAIRRSEKIIRTLIDKAVIPGMAVSVTQNGKTCWQRGYGFADIAHQLSAAPENTLYRIASVSKPVAATGLAKMTEAGLINLDASLYRYVPYFPKKSHDLTIDQLGSHTSGIRSYRGKELMNTKPLSLKEGIALFKDDLLRFTPGTGYLYSSFNWNLLALAMQEAAGMPFEDWIKEKVLLPLQMHRTLPDTPEPLLHKAVFYTRRKGWQPAFPIDNYHKMASGGYLSTAADLSRLGNAWLEGNFIPESIATRFVTSRTIQGKSTAYGIGWETGIDHKHRPYYGHEGKGIGGYAFFRIYPEQKMVFSILINVTRPKIDIELSKIINNLIAAACTFF